MVKTKIIRRKFTKAIASSCKFCRAFSLCLISLLPRSFSCDNNLFNLNDALCLLRLTVVRLILLDLSAV